MGNIESWKATMSEGAKTHALAEMDGHTELWTVRIVTQNSCFCPSAQSVTNEIYPAWDVLQRSNATHSIMLHVPIDYILKFSFFWPLFCCALVLIQ